MYKKLKKQNGEKFAQTVRNFHNGILEIPEIDVILRHAGRNAEPLLPYLASLLAGPDEETPEPTSLDPFALLDQAGYNAFYADTLKKQNSIASHFEKGELLCTFNDRARYQEYHIVNAVKKVADSILRDAFNGKEERDDAYGTSVISIQILKEGGFISIKNRYNHTVPGCDNTFNSNPDNIIPGLSAALKKYFDVEFSAAGASLPDEYVLMGNNVFKYHTESNNIYYGDNAWAKNGSIYTVDKSVGNALFNGYLFDNKTKTLKNIDPESADSFAENFNRCYGGNRQLSVKGGNLVLNDEILIGADNSRIKTIYLPDLTEMSDSCLKRADALTQFEAPALIKMGSNCLEKVDALTQFEAPYLATMGDSCFNNVRVIKHFKAPALTTMGKNCLWYTPVLKHFEAPYLATMGNSCLEHAYALKSL